MSAGRLAALLRGRPASDVRRMRRDITLVAMLATTVVLALVLLGVNLIIWHNVCRNVDLVLNLIELAGGDLRGYTIMGSGGDEVPDITVEALQEMPYDARYFTVTFSPEGEQLDSDLSSIASVDDASAHAMASAALKSDVPSGIMGSYRFRRVPMADGTMIIFLYIQDDLKYFYDFLQASVIMGLLGLAAFAAVVVPFARSATKPFEEARASQRRFVTDASHELRTPISIIRSATDVIEIESGESDWTRSIQHQVQRLEELTNKLLTLAKADEGAGALSLEDVDVSALSLSLAEEFESVSLASGRPLVCDIAPDVRCRADAGVLAQVVSILLDNAFKHSPEGSEVRFSVCAAGQGRARVLLSNEAPGMAPGSHPELFRRFFRMDESRAYQGGHGIGLAVVKAAVDALGGKVWACCDDGRITFGLEA